jgi:hypothetical protein
MSTSIRTPRRSSTGIPPRRCDRRARRNARVRDRRRTGPDVNAGEALTVPAERVHLVRNVGDGNATELATYGVEKGRPLFNVRKDGEHD